MKSKIKYLPLLLMLPGLSQAGWNPPLAANGVFPACSTNTLAPLTAQYPNVTTPSTWQFYACGSGAKYLAITVRKIRLIGVDGSVITALDKTVDTAIQPVDIVAQPLDLLKDVDTSTLTNGSFTIDKIELTFDSVIQANSLAKFRDQNSEVLQCGTTSRVFSGGAFDNTKASPIGSQGGSANGKPGVFYQKHGISNSSATGYGNTQGRSWLSINTFNLLPPGFTTDTYSFYMDGSGNVSTGLYSSAISATLDAVSSPSVKWVSIKAVDINGSPSGYVQADGNYNTKYVVNTMQLRSPLKISAKSKFNIDLNLDLSKMFGWAFYYTTSGAGNIAAEPNQLPNSGNGNSYVYTNDCLNLFIGPMLLKVKKSAIKDN